MRLTLRTLLGYLDDILEPQQAREIGEKINESTFASSLVARIKDVLRRRRITAPEVTGPDSDPDPNTVSEYLDNTLPPERVEDLERVCLGSDVHLAEVAACHQILTLVLGEPVDIPAELRERSYALGTRTRPEGTGRERSEAGASSATAVTGAATTAGAAGGSTPGTSKLPEYLQQPSTRWRQALPVAALLVIAAVWIGLILSDPSHNWRPDRAGVDDPSASPADGVPANVIARAEPQRGERQPADAVRDTDPSAVSPMPPADASQDPDAEPSAAPSADAPAATPGTSSPSINPPPPADLPESAPPAETAPDSETPAASPSVPNAAPAMPTRPESIGDTPMPTMPDQTKPAVASVDTHRILYNSNEGVLLQSSQDGEWMVLPRRSLVHPGDVLIGPAPFESVLQIDDTGATVSLMGGTRLSLVPPQSAPLALQIEESRVVFRRPAVGGTDAPLAIELYLGETAVTLHLMEAGTEVGMEITPRVAEGFDDPPLPPSWDGNLTVTSGAARLTTPQGELPLPSGRAVIITDGDIATASQASRGTPPWMVPLTGAALSVSRNYANQFEKEFQLDRTVSETIPALIESRQMRLSQLAVQTLSLAGDDRALVRALGAPHQEARLVAIVGLSSRLRSHVDNSVRINEELQRAYPEPISDIILRLLWGFPSSAAYDTDVSRELVSLLMHDLLAIRELAFFQILRLTGNQETNRYQPDAPETQRRVTTGYWENWIRRNRALRAAPADSAEAPNDTPVEAPIEPPPPAVPVP